VQEGKFIVLDGPDGGGKTSQVAFLKDHLENNGYSVVATRDPGGTPLGEKIRRLLLDNSAPPMSVDAELMLYMASRTQLCSQVIRPALERGDVVISERFLLSSIVYQGHAGGIPLGRVKEIGKLVVGDLCADLTIVLDVPPEIGTSRRGTRADRIEERGTDYHTRVREGFLAEAGENPQKIRIVSAEAPIDEVQRKIVEVVASVL
jgi:dTMP kinase